MASQQIPPRTTTWDNPFLEPPKRRWPRALIGATGLLLLLGGGLLALLLS